MILATASTNARGKAWWRMIEPIVNNQNETFQKTLITAIESATKVVIVKLSLGS